MGFKFRNQWLISYQSTPAKLIVQADPNDAAVVSERATAAAAGNDCHVQGIPSEV
ncbi:MAG: hypothetical protein H0W86_11585 [Armatimonadetes bacterium]|nr:hypothetical protein [Armatimonadota bacterium]